jgi:2-dehydropantoate 2-reductase
MKILIVGAGAVGGYYGAELARAGHAVTFVARGEHARAMREHGLVVDKAGAPFTVVAPVVEHIDAAAGMEADVVLVAVKAAALPEVSEGVGRALGAGGAAIPLLNGLDSEEQLAAVIGRERVIGGVAQISSELAAPGRIRVDPTTRIVLAPLDAEGFERVERLAQALTTPGFQCDARRDLARVLWTKLLWNAPFNAVCAITGRTAGEVLAIPELERLVRAAMLEVVAVAKAESVKLEATTIDATLDGTRSHFAGTVPSMLQDVRAGRATEARALQGAVVVRGARRGVPTPIHETLLSLVLGMQRNV